jgi:hypothetical protein
VRGNRATRYVVGNACNGAILLDSRHTREPRISAPVASPFAQFDRSRRILTDQPRASEPVAEIEAHATATLRHLPPCLRTQQTP